MSDIAYWVALNRFPKFGPRTFQKLEAHFASMKEAFFSDRGGLIAAGVKPNAVDEFVHLRENISPESLMAQLDRAGLRAVSKHDADYPRRLLDIYDPPPVLFVKGELPPQESPHLAIVGSRSATPYGLRAAADLAHDLARAGVVVVSGLAYGIDEAAHNAALKGQGKTIAVLGTGLLTLTSRERHLAEKIVQGGGAVISEFPVDAHAMKQNFPVRNRIIAGMSHGTLIVEAAIKSGSLITANAALEQGRDVFAVPGPITSTTSEGTNHLLKMGAHVVTEAADILGVLGVEKAAVPDEVKQYVADSKEESLILDLLSKTPVHIDELTRGTQLAPQAIASTLSLMEIKGRTKQIGGMYYVLT